MGGGGEGCGFGRWGWGVRVYERGGTHSGARRLRRLPRLALSSPPSAADPSDMDRRRVTPVSCASCSLPRRGDGSNMEYQHTHTYTGARARTHTHTHGGSAGRHARKGGLFSEELRRKASTKGRRINKTPLPFDPWVVACTLGRASVCVRACVCACVRVCEPLDIDPQ